MELYHHGVKGMHWGIRRYQNPDVTRIKPADNIYNEAKRREPKITKDFTNSVAKAGCKTYGMENRLKTRESIARKMKSKDVKDAIRYTAILSDKDFVKNYNAIKSDMASKGYTETRCKNNFEEFRKGNVSHKSVQCNYQTQDGYVFEIQFHTNASQKVKDKKVPLYNEARDPKTSTKRKGELTLQMLEMANSIEDPPGIDRIKSH